MSTLDSIKTQIHNTCGGTQLTDDTDHFVRRMFRCWLDGSYNGEESYKTHCYFVKVNHQSFMVMRSFVINQFSRYIAREFHCSTGHAQKCLVACMTTDQLNALNIELIEDAKDLVADYIEEQTKGSEEE